ncbi:hypothetical protein DRH13_04355 [Candidatus Woesebacteria bacterium]|nr:MAG: hypothetical protein DRH13_04355 [Candidatus Woesebacteria bacterium]
MEVVDFYPKTFQEIPEQDNPAFDNDQRKTCMMVVKSTRPNQKDHAVVLHIYPNGHDTVTRIAVFGRHDLALKYAESF